MNFTDGFEQFLGSEAFQQVNRSRPADNALNIFSVSSKTVSMTIWVSRICGFNWRTHSIPLIAAQIDVHQDDVGFFLGQLRDRFLGAAVDADALETFGGVHVSGDVLAQIRLVVDNGDSN